MGAEQRTRRGVDGQLPVSPGLEATDTMPPMRPRATDTKLTACSCPAGNDAWRDPGRVPVP
jgi:hypothetical protein